MATGIRSTRDRSRSKGAYAAGGGDGHRKRRGRLGGYGLLVLLPLDAVLLGPVGGDDDKQQAAQPTPSADATTPNAGQGSRGWFARRFADRPKRVSAARTRRRPDARETETATRKEVTVQSVVKDEGSWVGSSQRNRAYVEYGGQHANAEIAAALHLSVPTVKAHVSRLLDKLDVDNRVQIALLVQAAGEH